jgi:hypothetical protein
MPRKNKWDREIDDVLCDFSRQKSEIEQAHRLLETTRNGGSVPLEVLDDVIARLDRKHSDAVEALLALKKRLR